jgi:RNA polymerase sigma factor (sigma-70 family)
MELALSQVLSIAEMADDQDRRISETIAREQARLRNFIRRRAPEGVDAEDILQDVFSELVEAYRLMKPIGQAGAWLFRVARNRIIDSFRKRKREPIAERAAFEGDGEQLAIEELLPSQDGSPETAYARSVLLEELGDALEELPREQREVFIAHEIDGRSFKEIAAETGVSVNTLLSRKHYAVVHLRERLRDVYAELNSRMRR